MLNGLHQILLQLLFPPKCPGCRKIVAAHGQWCQHCLEGIWRPRMLSGSRDDNLDGCYCLTDYRGAMRRILKDIKFNKALKYEAACQYILQQFPWPERLSTIDMVVPVPLSQERLRKRTYNQVEMIYRPWAEKQWIWVDALERIKDTSPQWGLNKYERMDNIKSAFQVDGAFFVTGKQILLVDDIYTTGATMKECAQTLKKNGAVTVTGLVIASGAS